MLIKYYLEFVLWVFSRNSLSTMEEVQTKIRRRKRDRVRKKVKEKGKERKERIGITLTFKVIFTPLENIPTKPPLSTYVINICFVLFKRKSSGVKMTLKVRITPMEGDQLDLCKWHRTYSFVLTKALSLDCSYWCLFHCNQTNKSKGVWIFLMVYLS